MAAAHVAHLAPPPATSTTLNFPSSSSGVCLLHGASSQQPAVQQPQLHHQNQYKAGLPTFQVHWSGQRWESREQPADTGPAAPQCWWRGDRRRRDDYPEILPLLPRQLGGDDRYIINTCPHRIITASQALDPSVNHFHLSLVHSMVWFNKTQSTTKTEG